MERLNKEIHRSLCSFYISQKDFERKKKREQAKEYDVVVRANRGESDVKKPTTEWNRMYGLFSDDGSIEDGVDDGGKTGQLSEEQQHLIDKVTADIDTEKSEVVASMGTRLECTISQCKFSI